MLPCKDVDRAVGLGRRDDRLGCCVLESGLTFQAKGDGHSQVGLLSLVLCNRVQVTADGMYIGIGCFPASNFFSRFLVPNFLFLSLIPSSRTPYILSQL